jgi:uncharacterized membrane protein YjjP (DUF1212 family)
MAVAFRPAMNPTPQSDSRAPLDEVGALLCRVAALLYVNGQTTRNMIERVERLAQALGYSAECFPNWGEIVIRIAQTGELDAQKIVPVAGPPVGVDMHKVMKTVEVLDRVSAGRLDVRGAAAALKEIARLAPASTLRFAALAGAGAAALGVIFGDARPFSLALIAVSAAAGAVLRRFIATCGGTALAQVLGAALLAGLLAAGAVRFLGVADATLLALCPCMVLMPGPHFLNAALDFAHLRIALGQARFSYAALLTLLICVGLIAGLSLGQQSLPTPGPATITPLTFDVLAAGVAVAAYGTFFSMPWRALPIPIAIGMVAHASRWVALDWGANAPLGALIACLIVGTLATPIANRLHFPFAAFAFASVVSLIPGAYLFHMAAELLAVMNVGSGGDVQLLMATFVDGATAGAILLAMALGLSLPKLLMERLLPTLAGLPKGTGNIGRRED